MRIFALIPALAAFVTVVAGAAVPADASCGLEIGCDESQILLSDGPSITSRVTYSGVIEVLDSNDESLGYVPKNLHGEGHSHYDPLLKNALVVTFTTSRSRTDAGFSTGLYLTATNLNPTYPFLGLIQGRDDEDSDLNTDSYHYLYLGGVSAPGTQPLAPPSEIGNSYNGAHSHANRTAESAVWTYDATSSVLTPQWINTDGSLPHEEFFTQKNVLYVGGSKDEFSDKYHKSPVTTIKFKFVPA